MLMFKIVSLSFIVTNKQKWKKNKVSTFVLLKIDVQSLYQSKPECSLIMFKKIRQQINCLQMLF